MNINNVIALGLSIIVMTTHIFSDSSIIKNQLNAKVEANKLNYVSNQVIIKFKDDIGVGYVADAMVARGQSFSTIIGDNKIDKVLKKYRVSEFKKVFKTKSPVTLPRWEKITSSLVDSIQAAAYASFRNSYPSMKKSKSSINLDNIYTVQFEKGNQSVKEIINELKKESSIEYVTPNYIATSDLLPNDERFDEQWSHKNTNIQTAWDIQTGSSDVIIAVIDGGVDYNHPDLKANIWRDQSDNPGKDFVDIDTELYREAGFQLPDDEDYTIIDNDPMDYNGHGTHCAGIAAASGNNKKGVAGVAFNCQIMPVRAGFEISGRGVVFEYDDIVNAIVYAADNDADIISMSFGGNNKNPLLENALDYAEGKGAILIASAGNDHSDRVKYPAGYDNVIAVASSNECNDKASYSNYGSWVDVVAPGGDNIKKCNAKILSTVPHTGGMNTDESGYNELQGTSMACPYIAGVAALIKSQYPQITASEIRSRILTGTDNISSIFHGAALLGSGLINVNKTLTITEQTFCMLRKFTTVDLNGKGDPVLLPNSTRYLVFEVENIWASVSDVSVEIQLNAPEITLSHTTVNLGAMARGQKKDNSADPITISIGEFNFEGLEKSFPVAVLIHFDSETIIKNKTLVVVKDFRIIPDYEQMGAGHDISGHLIVYSEYKGDEDQIRTRCYNTITDKINVVSKFDGYQGRSKYSYLPRISMQKVVWCDTRNGQLFGDDIYMYDLLTNTESAINTDEGLQYLPEISADQIVWASLKNPMDPDLNFNIYRFNSSTDQQSTICDDPFFQMNPAVYGNNIIWLDSRHMGSTITPLKDPKIYLFNGAQQTPVVTIIAQKSSPKMFGNYIVWDDDRNGNKDIYMYNIATGVETPVCVNSAEQRKPEIFGDRIVWTDFRRNGVFCDVYMYTISTGEEIALTANPLVSQGVARISSGKVCWLEKRNGKLEIRYTELENYNMGDVNGDKEVDITDALSIAKYIQDKEQYNELQWENADVSVDGYVSIHDARIVAAYYVGSLEKVKNQLVIGDINGDGNVDMNDFYLCKAVVTGQGTLNTLQNIACDVNGDSIISVLDLQLIYLYANNTINIFPFVKK